jgi:hypothetical protein
MDQIFDTEAVGAPTYTALGPGLSWKEKDRGGEGDGEETSMPIPVRIIDSRRGSAYENAQRSLSTPTSELNRNNNYNNNIHNNNNNHISGNDDECDDPFVDRSSFQRSELAGVNKNLDNEYSSSSSSVGFTSTVNPLTESLNVNVYMDDENEENDDKENDDDVKSDHDIDDININIL